MKTMPFIIYDDSFTKHKTGPHHPERPERYPGHHATSTQGMGFCIFNNIALCARYAQKKYQIGKILIVDWDAHHGNGTQAIFYEDPNVFYFSTHQYPFYPGTGSENERGYGKGLGTTLNCPIAPGAYSRIEVIEAFQRKLLPAMEKFKPELVLISAGFDAHERDPLGGFTLKTEDYIAVKLRTVTTMRTIATLIFLLAYLLSLPSLNSLT
jgi:acetoin utilization deacetylase AcuC-like enzyme